MVIPISKAKEISKEFNCSKVIIYAIEDDVTEHVVTYGETKKDCLEAVEIGNDIKRLMGWPEEECYVKPDENVLKNKPNE